MRRAVVSFAGVIFGAFLTWFCLYMFSHIQWPKSNRVVEGCHELGKCAAQWWAMAGLFAYIFGPSLLLGSLNAIAWKRWRVRRWAAYFATATFGIVGLYLYGYASA
ncbi:hypothetical protein PQR67_01275 [Paraburkholderia fungorum]|uniref:hypothetical protein n=1 Tax=Paraburkholderia fungorum TaxID=134537 RepID=UPI0038BC9B42